VGNGVSSSFSNGLTFIVIQPDEKPRSFLTNALYNNNIRTADELKENVVWNEQK
jgi:hypothetical protein